jgi:hypothetical protein
MYRWVDERGEIHFGDQPPPSDTRDDDARRARPADQAQPTPDAKPASAPPAAPEAKPKDAKAPQDRAAQPQRPQKQ